MKVIHILRKQSGFTLIELLLVIAVIAVLVTFGFSTYREHAINLQAEKVAQQMQQIMQAASTYYTRNGCWPNSTVDRRGCVDKSYPDDFMAPGIPGVGYFPWPGPMRHPTVASNLQLYNPFSLTFTGAADDVNATYQYYRIGSNTNPEGIFQVDSGVLPNAEFARRVAALLPNASVVKDPKNFYEVSMQIYPPGALSLPSVILAGMGRAENDNNGNTQNVNNRNMTNGIQFDCPTNYKPLFTISIQGFDITQEGGIDYRLHTISHLSGQVYKTKFDYGGGRREKGKECTITGNRHTGSTTIYCHPFVNIQGGLVPSGANTSADIQNGNASFFYTASCCLDSDPTCKAFPEYLERP